MGSLTAFGNEARNAKKIAARNGMEKKLEGLDDTGDATEPFRRTGQFKERLMKVLKYIIYAFND